jgi:hypothetical protein
MGETTLNLTAPSNYSKALYSSSKWEISEHTWGHIRIYLTTVIFIASFLGISYLNDKHSSGYILETFKADLLLCYNRILF